MFDYSTRPCIVLGCASSVWKDAEEAFSVYGYLKPIVFAVNDIGLHFNHIHVDHLVSLHDELVTHIRGIRKIRDLDFTATHSYKHADGVDFCWREKIPNHGGTSTLFAVEIALQFNANKVIVCGTPLDNSPHYYEDQRLVNFKVFDFGKSGDTGVWTNTFENRLAEHKHKIRFVSGSLKHFFGGIDGDKC